jgi:hypothetical protein
MAKKTPDPLKPAHIPGQNPATPERMPGHTGYYEKEEGAADSGRQDGREQDKARNKRGRGDDRHG